MTAQDEIKAVENNLKQAKELVEFGNALARLQTNRDYKTVIAQAYFEQEAIRLVHLKADANMQTTEMQSFIVKQMDAIGALKQFFRAAVHRSTQAVRTIADDEETLTELMLEGAAE